MIERQTIDGRDVTVAYLTRDWQPATKDNHDLAKLLFDDGEMILLTGNSDDPDKFLREHATDDKPTTASILGRTYAQWAKILLADDLSRIDSAIRNGLTEGIDNTEIARKVVGSQGLNGVDGVTEITRRRIARLGHAAIKALNLRKSRERK